MPTETLSISATSSPDNWTNTGGADKVASVALPDDGDTSYISSGTTSGTEQQFAVANTTDAIAPNASMTSVTITCRAKKTSVFTVGIIASCILSGNTSTGSTHTLSTGYQDFTDTFTTKPGGGAWTKADVDAIEVKVKNSAARDVLCTSVSLAVNYTLVAAQRRRSHMMQMFP
jgi:hypothetical protein